MGTEYSREGSTMNLYDIILDIACCNFMSRVRVRSSIQSSATAATVPGKPPGASLKYVMLSTALIGEGEKSYILHYYYSRG